MNKYYLNYSLLDYAVEIRTITIQEFNDMSDSEMKKLIDDFIEWWSIEVFGYPKKYRIFKEGNNEH